MVFSKKMLAPLLRLLVIAILVAAALPWTSVRAQDADPGACGDPATPIHDVQGAGERTPIGGESVTLEGVIIGDYQDYTQLEGFFIQEEDADADADPATSEGVFVDSRLLKEDVQVGDVVRMTATVFDVNDTGRTRTQLSRIKSFEICSSGAEVTPTLVTLPLANAAEWEQYEGMLVTFDQELTVTQLYNLGRYGEIELSAGGRLYQPTNIAQPGAAADAVAAENAARSFYIDDAISLQNPDPTFYPVGGLSADNGIRNGDTITGVSGVFDDRYGLYLLYPPASPDFAPANPRTTAPELAGRLRVASFNVLNYFNGDGSGGGFPTERGANSAEEFARQQAKIVAAISALDADVIGLMEIENDGDGPESAVADLTHALNVQAGDMLYAYVGDPEGQALPDEGADAIKQAIIYNTTTVQPVGDPVTTLAAPFDIRRPTIVQAFEEIATGEVFIVGVNHLKSKSCPGSGDNGDQGDGQSCWNAERVQAAQTLSAWLATDPTGTGDPDVLLIGDLNAYALEDPLIAFEDAGYTNLVVAFEGETNYSYVYYGQAGSLDHALASASLVEQVAGTVTWHINADEPSVFDYNVEYKTDNHVESLYAANPYRSSDHDPVVIGLDLSRAASATATPEPTEEPTAAPTEAPTEEPTEEPTVAPTEAPTEEPTVEPTVAPETETGSTDDLNDATGGLVAIIGGAVALLIAMIAAAVGRRRK